MASRVVTTPSVAYEVDTTARTLISKGRLMRRSRRVSRHSEPWMRVDVVTREYIGNVMAFVQERRGVYRDTAYLSGAGGEDGRVILHYDSPLSSLPVDFYDTLKSVSSGYASLNYDFAGVREADVVRLDIYVAEVKVEALAAIVYRDAAEYNGRRIVERLKDAIPREQFEIKLQAAVGGKVVASERIKAYRRTSSARFRAATSRVRENCSRHRRKE